ncbi:MAG: hypothetical protein GX580_09965 [Candidatus Hydrogenedens sp.]|nr:hypothetical protein [Candidatus Hydrogenedentota bacterium]NLF57953.1 hypothetical protein [Candidatus Hydrogenedens sp.]
MNRPLTTEELERLGALLDGECADGGAEARWAASDPALAAYLGELRALRAALGAVPAPAAAPDFADRVLERTGLGAPRKRDLRVIRWALPLAASLLLAAGLGWWFQVPGTVTPPVTATAAQPAVWTVEELELAADWYAVSGDGLEGAEALPDDLDPVELARVMAEGMVLDGLWENGSHAGPGHDWFENTLSLYAEVEALAEQDAELLDQLLRTAGPEA